MNKTSVATKVSYATILVTALFMIFVGYQLFSPFNPATVQEPIKIQNKDVAKGEPVVLLLTSCTDIETTVDLDFEVLAGDGSNTAIKLFTLVDIPTKRGCVESSPLPIDLDKSNLQLKSGEYKIRLKTTYQVNSLRTVKINYDTETFNYIAEE